MFVKFVLINTNLTNIFYNFKKFKEFENEKDNFIFIGGFTYVGCG